MVFRIENLPRIMVGDKIRRPRVFRVKSNLSGTIALEVNMGEATKRTGLAGATLTSLGVTTEGINVDRLKTSLEANIPDELKPQSLRNQQTTAQNVFEAVVGRIAAGTDAEGEVFAKINIADTLQKASDAERIPLAAAYISESAGDVNLRADMAVTLANLVFPVDVDGAGLLRNSFVADVARALYGNNMTPRRIFAAEAAVRLYPDRPGKQDELVDLIVDDPRYESIALREMKHFQSAVLAARRIKDPMERAIQMRANAIAMAEAKYDGKEIGDVFQAAIEAGYFIESPRDKAQLFESIAAEMAGTGLSHAWVGLMLQTAIRSTKDIANPLEVRNRLWAVASLVNRLKLERAVAEFVLRTALEAAERISDGEAKVSALAWIRKEQEALTSRQT